MKKKILGSILGVLLLAGVASCGTVNINWDALSSMDKVDVALSQTEIAEGIFSDLTLVYKNTAQKFFDNPDSVEAKADVERVKAVYDKAYRAYLKIVALRDKIQLLKLTVGEECTDTSVSGCDLDVVSAELLQLARELTIKATL